MKVTKKDIKAAKTLMYVGEKIRKDNNRDRGNPLEIEEAVRNNEALLHLKARFGKQWYKVTQEIVEIETIKKSL